MAVRRGFDPKKLSVVMELLCSETPLPDKYWDHALVNSRNYKEKRECHIDSGWLLVYKIYREELILEFIRTGTHSDLF